MGNKVIYEGINLLLTKHFQHFDKMFLVCQETLLSRCQKSKQIQSKDNLKEHSLPALCLF